MPSARLAAAAASKRTEQEARYSRVLRLTHEKKQRGQTTARIRIADLEALIFIAAATDVGVRS